MPAPLSPITTLSLTFRGNAGDAITAVVLSSQARTLGYRAAARMHFSLVSREVTQSGGTT